MGHTKTEIQALDMICIGGDAICSHWRFNNITEHNTQRYEEGWMFYGRNMKEKTNKSEEIRPNQIFI